MRVRDPQAIETWTLMLGLTLALAVVLAVALMGCQMPLR